MEENQNPTASNNPEQAIPSKEVGFPQPKLPKKSKSKLIGLIVIFIFTALLIGGGIFIFTKPDIEKETENLPTPTVGSIDQTSEVTPEPTMSEVDKEDIRISILNGTGVSGAAKELQTKLEKLNYSNFKVGNASTKTEVTLVVFNESIDAKIKDEITKELEKSYEDVTVSQKKLVDIDVEITTGYTKGFTPSPTSKPVTATPTVKLTTTVTPTKTPTPTPANE